MNAAAVSRVLSLIPDRSVRVLSGSPFTDDEAARAEHADRVQYVAKFLGWLSPLNPITKDDQRFLGLLTTHARPELVADAEDDVADDELEAGADALEEETADQPRYDEAPAPQPLGISAGHEIR